MKKYNKENINKIDIDTLIKSIQTNDNQLKAVLRPLQIVFSLFILIYAGLFLFNLIPGMSTIYHRITGGCYILAFILFIIYFRKYYKKIKSVNYFESVKKVLEDAEQRYRFWHSDVISALIAFLLIDAGTFSIFLYAFSDKFTFTQIFVSVQVLCFFVIGVSSLIGYVIWKKESRPIWLSAKKLLKELEE
jgi:Ca2+/Na+ antiporter